MACPKCSSERRRQIQRMFKRVVSSKEFPALSEEDQKTVIMLIIGTLINNEVNNGLNINLIQPLNKSINENLKQISIPYG